MVKSIMKDKMRGTILKTYGDHIESRFWIFLCNKDDVFTVLNFSNDYTEIMQMYDSCKNVYEDFVDFIYDFENDRLLDYGENPDAEDLFDNVDCEVEVEEQEDVVNKPKHYNREGAMECFDEFVELYGVEAGKVACLFNIHKYRYRASDKNGLEDLKKSDWYMAKYKELNKK